ncbi:MAG: HAMP domain-containing protein [Proteobacteria bacterium]|nr:HAMP domain-containing protein [Pseudomonadota bacterium]
MSIRLKIIALLAGIFAGLAIAEILVERQVIMPSFASLEHADARTAMRRIENALDLAQEQVVSPTVDWGNWAVVYRFMGERNPATLNDDITVSAMRDIRVNLALLVDSNGRVVFAREAARAGERPPGLDLAGAAALPADFPWRPQLLAGVTVKGFLATPQGVLMIAGAPVLDGAGHGPARGAMIMGRLLTPDVVRAVGAQAQASVVMLPPVAGESVRSLTEGARVTQVYRSFPDIYGRPLFRLRVDVPRDISALGRTAVRYASACLLGAAIIVLFLVLYVLNRTILKPLAAVTRHAVAVGQDKDLTNRLDLKRRDEIGTLARELDRMVARLARSRAQLVDQSFQAGFAELARGVLHNLGNAMTPIGVRLASLGERLKQAPAEDACQAVGELRAGATDPGRAADLREFLCLASEELARSVTAARTDIAVMARQAALVQSVLTEQLRPARNEHVIEPVRLTDLLTQALEIVPDTCRRQLAIDTDPTLIRVGVVRVARTVLRLVLQNLIINAADAVRAAGKSRGTLRVSAELQPDGGRQQLHLQCRDDGVGIAAPDLERVFEKGFTTKSRETNHGIGLHWCANAIGALGGRIWASSEGPGQGASLHVLVPLATPETAALAGAA